jgi:hypothetical protein
MLLAFDLDKTIVTNAYELPKAISKTIKRVRKAGHLVTIITGRARVAATDYLRELEIKEYYSVNHGALVIGKNELVLQHSRIPAEAAQAIISPYAEHPEVEFSFFEGDVFYVKNPDDERWSWAQTQHRQIERYEVDLGIHADKIVFSANGLTKELHEHVRHHYPDFVTYLWDDGFLEITGKKADKGSALKLLAETLGVAQQDTIAFGDGPNDVTMLEWAGRSIVVGPHAHTEALKHADEHIPSPEQLGVATWLEQNLL